MSVVINGSAGVTTNSGAVYNGIQAGTTVSASTTAVAFTNIPSWVKRVTVMLDGISTNGTSNPIFQLGTGTSPTYVTSGYLGAGGYLSGSPSTSNYTTGFGILSALAANVIHGSIVFTNISGNTWVANGVFALSNNNVSLTTAGSIPLGAALTAIQITTVGGANTFDAGTINILYE